MSSWSAAAHSVGSKQSETSVSTRQIGDCHPNVLSVCKPWVLQGTEAPVFIDDFDGFSHFSRVAGSGFGRVLSVDEVADKSADKTGTDPLV